MLLTEEQAREKWCPQVRDGTDGPVCNRWLDGDGKLVLGPSVNCIASGCNLWEWWIGPPTGLPRAVYQETSDKTLWRGYCGLKGLRRLTVSTP